MQEQISQAEEVAIRNVVRRMEHAWNQGDAQGFAAPMAENVDFITIRADHLCGRQAVIDSHIDVLSTFYAGSINHFNVESIRMLHNDVALAHVRAVLEAPNGPLQGRHEAMYSLVLLKENGTWEATSFHITLITLAPPAPQH